MVRLLRYLMQNRLASGQIFLLSTHAVPYVSSLSEMAEWTDGSTLPHPGR